MTRHLTPSRPGKRLDRRPLPSMRICCLTGRPSQSAQCGQKHHTARSTSFRAGLITQQTLPLSKSEKCLQQHWRIYFSITCIQIADRCHQERWIHFIQNMPSATRTPCSHMRNFVCKYCLTCYKFNFLSTKPYGISSTLLSHLGHKLLVIRTSSMISTSFRILHRKCTTQSFPCHPLQT